MADPKRSLPETRPAEHTARPCAAVAQAEFPPRGLRTVRGGLLLVWWQHYYEPMGARRQREITSSVINKPSKFASSRVARRILGQPR